MGISPALKKSSLTFVQKALLALFAICFAFYGEAMARAGGGGGGHGGGGGGGFHGGGGGFGIGGGGYGGGGMSPGFIILIIIIVVIVIVVRGRMSPGQMTGEDSSEGGGTGLAPETQSFPEGLDHLKVQSSFIEIQNAWMHKDLKIVRKWISDGIYQRYIAQFGMMNKLSQVNKLSNIRINGISVVKTATDGTYQTADVGVSFTIDDEFVSDKYPEFNETFMDDSDTEYWTFIKRTDGHKDKNLYDNNNCPNCGALLEIKLGEISRCSSCGTLTNNASYDWVLSKITQSDDYTGQSGLGGDPQLHELVKNDNLFAVERLEDVASNVFMQVMQVLTGAPEKKLSRFADQPTVDTILQQKAKMGNFVFDRLYLDDVTLSSYNTNAERLNLVFNLSATFQRVKANGHLSWIDPQMVTSNFKMVLSKNLKSLQTAKKETVYSFECSNCGAPYDDTTNDVCPYCGTAVVDFDKNWVLTEMDFSI